MMQDGEESANGQKEGNKSKMLESEGASPIGNHIDPRAGGKSAASGPDSSDNELMEMNQQLPNKGQQNLFEGEDEDDEDK